MKTTFLPPTLLLLALFLHSANLAAQPAPGGQAAGRSADRTETTPPPADDEDHQDVRGRMMSALKNTEVVGTQNETLGRLADFVADIETGQIIYGVVEPGPSGGPDTQRVAPFPAFIPELAGNALRLRLNLDEAAWKRVPGFDDKELDRLARGNLPQEDVYHHFNLPPPRQTRPDAQRLLLLGSVVGKPLHRDRQVVGEITDAVIHLDTRMAAVVLDPRPDFVGTDQRFLLPLRSIVGPRPAQPDRLETALPLTAFTSAPAATDATWAISGTGFVTPYLWPEYGTSAVPLTAAPAPAVTLRPLTGGPPVEAIREALAADSNTKWLTVRVVAGPNRVILQGVVQDEDDKRRAEARAAQAAGGWTIDNQIRLASNVTD